MPTAIVKFLESDTQHEARGETAAPRRGRHEADAQVGDQIPVISTSYRRSPAAARASNPLSSYKYKDVGVNVDMTPRVTLEGDILLDVSIDQQLARQRRQHRRRQRPVVRQQRKVTTRLRLRDGESNLLAGLLREDERKSLNGFPGAIHVPVLKQLFSANDERSPRPTSSCC